MACIQQQTKDQTMEKIKQYILAGSPFGHQGGNEVLLRSFNDLFNRQSLSSAALAVGTTTTKFKVGTAAFVVIAGVLQLVAVQDGPVLAGYALTAAQVGGYVVSVDGSGVLYANTISAGAAIGNVGFPMIPPNQAVLGVIVINAVNAATFTAGTTLMSATNVSYINLVGPTYPNSAF
jgi:hypothetical protein